jgi:hypothetical protein
MKKRQKKNKLAIKFGYKRRQFIKTKIQDTDNTQILSKISKHMCIRNIRTKDLDQHD